MSIENMDPGTDNVKSEGVNTPTVGPETSISHASGDGVPQDAIDFLNALDSYDKAFTWQTFDDNEERCKKRDEENKERKVKGLTSQIHNQYIECFSSKLSNQHDFLKKLNDDKAGVYVTVNQTNLKGRKKTDVERIRAVFCDYDRTDGVTDVSLDAILKRLNFPIEPSMIVQSSPGKYHFYFLVSDEWPVNKSKTDNGNDADFAGVMGCMIEKYASDPACKDQSRVLRLPGYYHNKKEPQLVKLLCCRGPKYTKKDILAAFPPIAKSTTTRRKKIASDTSTNTTNETTGNATHKLAADTLNEYAWYDLALDNHIEELKEAGETEKETNQATDAKAEDTEKKGRNNTLNKMAFRLGQVIAISELQRETVEKALYDTAIEIGLGHGETEATIKSGVDKGLGSPMDRPMWVRFVERSKVFVPDFRNIFNVFSFLDWTGIKLRHDVFANRVTVSGWQGYTELNDQLKMELWRKAQKIGMHITKNDMADMLEAKALEVKYHPVKDYLNSLKWDGVKRLDTFLPYYFDTEDNEYTRTVGKITLVAAVKRIFEPGCKFDEELVLEGRQGNGKSAAVRELAVNREWFTDSITFKDDAKVMLEKMEGKWIGEHAELKGLRRGDTDHVKAQQSKQEDRARKAYGRFTTETPRQYITIGTVNTKNENDHYLNDITGNRRFWPVKTGKIKVEQIAKDRDQLYAEAVHLYRQGMSIRLPEELWLISGAEQDKRQKSMVFSDVVEDKLGELEGAILVEDVKKLLSDNKKWTDEDNRMMGIAMKEYGWERNNNKRLKGRKRTWYVKGDTEVRLVLDEERGSLVVRQWNEAKDGKWDKDEDEKTPY
jgi:hypothetical protein